jgi:hypothetical protein
MLSSPVISQGRRGFRKKSDTLVAALFTLLGAAVIAIAILASIIQKRNATIDALREKITGMTASHPLSYFADRGGSLPVATTAKKSPLSSGYMLTIANKCSEMLPLVVDLQNTNSGAKKTVTVEIDGLQTAEFGSFDNWHLAEGDVIEISHEGFSPITMRLR